MTENADSALQPAPKLHHEVASRRRAEAALRHSEAFFRLLVEGVREYAIFGLDRDGHVISWNAGAARIKGYSADEIIGEHFSRFYPQEAIDRGWPQYELEAAQREGRFED